MHLHATTSRFRTERGQAAIEFALVLPLLIAFLFLIVGFARVFNAYNDLNQMAADGARFAAVGNFPGATALLNNADTPLSQSATIAGPAYQAPSSSKWGDPCTVGGTVKVTATANVQLIPFLPYVNSVLPGVPTLTGTAEMRVERCPSS
jgi:Flp pilus assembly protein TadG